MLDESGLLPLLIPSSSARSPSLLLPNELLGDLTGADRGGERRNDGNGNLAMLGNDAGAATRLELLPIDELDSLGRVNDSLAPVTGAALRGEGASLVGRTKNRAASPIWCSAKFQHCLAVAHQRAASGLGRLYCVHSSRAGKAKRLRRPVMLSTDRMR